VINIDILGKRLKDTRTKTGKNQDIVANDIGINRVTYTGYETGKHDPSIDILIKLADYFKTSIDYLVGRYKE